MNATIENLRIFLEERDIQRWLGTVGNGPPFMRVSSRVFCQCWELRRGIAAQEAQQ